MIVLCWILIIAYFYYLNKSLKGRRKSFRVVVFIISVLIIWFLIFNVDFYRSKKNKKPLFANNFNGIVTYQDGGTTVYFGIGYKIYSFNTAGLRCNVICSYFTTYKEAKDKAIKNIY